MALSTATTLALSKKYTEDTAYQFGAVKGAPCQISKIDYDASGNTVIDFLWQNNAGATQTSQAIIKKGEKGDKGNGIKELKFNADGKLVAVLDDGTETTPVVMPSTKVNISKETGNVIEEKTDGLYVCATGVEISKDTDNAIETKSDGLYVKKTNSAEISKKVDNIIKQETDGLYVPKADAQVQADFNQTDATKTDFIKNKPTVDQTYSATSENAQSGKSVASAIATEIGKLTYLTKEIATKTEIDEYVADPTKAKFNTIYLLKDASAKGTDKYFEYQRLGDETTSTFEMTGDTSTDLSDYVKKDGTKVLSTNDYTNDDKDEVGKVKNKLDTATLTDQSLKKIHLYDDFEIESNGTDLPHLHWSDGEIVFGGDNVQIHSVAGEESRVTVGDGIIKLEGSPYNAKNATFEMGLDGNNKTYVKIEADDVTINGKSQALYEHKITVSGDDVDSDGYWFYFPPFYSTDPTELAVNDVEQTSSESERKHLQEVLHKLPTGACGIDNDELHWCDVSFYNGVFIASKAEYIGGSYFVGRAKEIWSLSNWTVLSSMSVRDVVTKIL